MCQVILLALTSSIRLDQEERNRSFQKTKETYLGIMREVAGNVSGSGLSVETGVPVIQYRETDWEFCRRMAAGAGQVLYADPASPEIRLWAGLEEKGGTASFPADRYSVCVDETYYHMKSAGEGKKEFLYYRTESWENYEIGESSFYQGQRRYVFEKTAELVGGVLVFGYKLGGKCRFGQKRYANWKMAGVSLRGTVEKREKESVYLKLDIDGADGKALHPYPWIPPTGNVMYCMPQEGTEAYLYFPEAEEESAYAVSEIHNSRCPVFADAQSRGLVTEHGKKLRLHADMLGFAGGKEETVQECRMGEDGIHFGAGTGKLQVTGSGQITFRAPEISLDAVQKIGQYKMESMAKEKAGMLYPRGGGNPATAASDQKNGTESSLGDYISNAFSASARVGASCIAITLGMYGAEVMTLTVSGGMGLIPVGGTVVTLPQLAGAFQFVAGTVTSQNLLFQMREVRMFCISGKEMGAPTGNWLYDSARELTEMASTQFAVYGLMNPYTYQRPKITPLPNETGLTVPGGTGVAVVPNRTAPALKQPYLPGQYTEYPAVVQGWAQQALPGGGSSIEGGSDAFQIGKTDLDALRNKLGVPETDTIAVGKTDVKGLEGVTFEGQSPKVRSEAGLPDLDEIWAGRNIKSPGNNPLFTRHAEEVLANDFDRAVIEAGINPQDVSGVLKIHQSNPTGVCRKCIQGLANDNVSPGVLKQLSLKYPNLRIEVTSEILPDVKVTGKSNFVIQNGQYVE